MAGTTRIDFFSNAAAGTSASFNWKGGQLAIVAEATWGSLQMQYQSMSGAWVNIGSAITANGQTILNLPPGALRAVTTLGSGYYVSGVEVPTNVRH